MPVNMSEARALCSKPELQLVQWSTPRRIGELPPARLREKIARARKLRDKFTDLARSQRRESRGKQAPRRTRTASGNERTVRKKLLFAETLERFEKQLAKVEKAWASTQTARKTSKKKTSKKATKKAPRKTASKVSKKKATKKSARKATSRPAAKKASSRKSVKKKGTLKKLTSRSLTTAATAGASGGSSAAPILSQDHVVSDLRRTKLSKKSKGARERNRHSRMSMQKIHGHVSGAGRRNQARRDSKR